VQITSSSHSVAILDLWDCIAIMRTSADVLIRASERGQLDTAGQPVIGGKLEITGRSAACRTASIADPSYSPAASMNSSSVIT
jgi:hypothetical protein